MFRHISSAQARSNAYSSHSADWPIIDWIRKEWVASGGKKSKRAFAKEYVPKIFKEFGEHRNERTISESWLKGY